MGCFGCCSNPQKQKSDFDSNDDANPQLQRQIKKEIHFSKSLLRQSCPNPQGLPNLGLTCYLNTVLLILFSMEQLRTLILHNSRDRPDLVWNRQIGKIFQTLVEGRTMQDKRRALEDLFDLMEKEQKDISIKNQNDLVRFFNVLVDSLSKEDSQIQSLLFLVSKKQCQCYLELEYKELLVGLGEECMTCKEKINISVIDPPPSYLITVINRTQDNSDEFVCLTDERGRRLSFEMISFASYNGNGSTGHYTCLIKQRGGWVEYNDAQVKSLEAESQWRRVSRISIYKRSHGQAD